ncbi:MAG: helix-turn-helix domain-containing protein [Saprospiraceae bacterium]|nr:helix-turn-helix domain-containing protein [Saprospiraceae bacterium]
MQTPTRNIVTKSIAVLPFVNMSADTDNEYLCDGMTEEIINALAKIKGLKVTSRTSSFFFKNKNLPIQQIGGELNVAIILEGSIRLAGNKMRITAQLIDVAEDFHFWSETFNRSLDDIFAVQDEISLLIADKLREHIGHFDIDDHLADVHEVPVQVYKRYLKSRFHVLKMNKLDLDKGISILEGIIQEQPNFALANLGLHLGYALLGSIGAMPAFEAFSKGKPYLDKAIALNDNLPECQLQLSHMAIYQQWDLQSGYKHLNKSFEIRPTVEFYQSMASALTAEQKFEAALEYVEVAIQLDPFTAINHHMKGFIFYVQEKYAQAIEQFSRALKLNPDFITSTLSKGQALLLAGRMKEGLRCFEELPPKQENEVIRLGGKTLAHALMGNVDQAAPGILQLEGMMQTDSMGQVLNFLLYSKSALGNDDEVFPLIEQAIRLRLPMLVFLPAEPLLKPLRTKPRFQELMEQILGKPTSHTASKKQYKQSLLDRKLIEQYKEQLESLMSEKDPYLDPNLTLRALAEMMEISPNHLSRLLNEGLDKNFSEYVNSYRLEAFKVKIADPSLKHLTILGLAYESGFSSKTVFNSYFKKMMGLTPKTYQKEIKAKRFGL